MGNKQLQYTFCQKKKKERPSDNEIWSVKLGSHYVLTVF